MKVTKLATLAAGGAALALALTGCVQQAGPQATPGVEGGVQGGEPVTIGIKYDQPGLGQQAGADFEGFDVEVARYVAKEMGYGPVTFVKADSAQRETMIQGGQVQMIFATYSITDARKEKVSFAGPYFIAGQGLLVRADDTSITGPDTLNGKKLCSVAGSTPAEKIKSEYAEQVDLREYGNYSQCVEALASGAIDAVTTDDVILAGFAAQDQYKDQLKVVGEPFTEERYGVGIKKGDVELCNRINAALTKMIDEGAWQAALDTTVGPAGFTPNAATNPPTSEPCS